MNAKLVFRILGLILLLESAALLLPAMVSMLYREQDWPVFLLCAALAALAGGVMVLVCRKAVRGIHAREGFALTGFAWLLLSLFGALPYSLTGLLPSFVDAFFETVAGFTTTGASVLLSLESMSHAVAFWRSLTQWLGGMGVLILFLALLPALGERSIQLMRAESPGPIPSKLVPRISDSSKILYLIYTLLTFLNALVLRIAGMGWFDAVLHAMGTASTGGFSNRTTSMAGYGSAVQLITVLFMILFGMNFAVFYHLYKKRVDLIRRNTEVWVYLGIIGICTLLVLPVLLPSYQAAGRGAGSALRDALFQVSSMVTSTGYTTANFDLWPGFARSLMVILMIIGACAGSTGSGIKISRVMLLAKNLTREIKKNVHPRSVSLVRVGGRVVDDDVLWSTMQFLVAYAFLLLGGTLLVSLDDLSFTSSVTAVIAALSNVGLGLDQLAPGMSFGALSVLSKLVLSLLMLIGRLEIFPILILLAPSTWKKN